MKTSPPLVSIIINNYNYEAFLAQAMESALAQTYTPVEVVVVDDGSVDNSRAVIERYAAQYKGRVIPVLKENGGQASALNAGVLASQVDIICFLDADDIYLPEKVAETVAAFEVDDSIEWFFQRSTINVVKFAGYFLQIIPRKLRCPGYSGSGGKSSKAPPPYPPSYSPLPRSNP